MTDGDGATAKQDCIFCRILSGEEEASFVYRDDRVSAFLDRAPINPGHTIVVPNEHAAWMSDLDPDLGAHVFTVGMQVAQGLRTSSLRCDGINMWLADGEAAFQIIFHAHLHVFPRFKGDGFAITRRNWVPAPREHLERAAEQVRTALEHREAVRADRP
jgi:histidine triad (HIT) family protein